MNQRAEIRSTGIVMGHIQQLGVEHGQPIYLIVDGINKCSDNWNDLRDGPLGDISKLVSHRDGTRVKVYRHISLGQARLQRVSALFQRGRNSPDIKPPARQTRPKVSSSLYHTLNQASGSTTTTVCGHTTGKGSSRAHHRRCTAFNHNRTSAGLRLLVSTQYQ